jgi:hypothetical protein
VILPMRPMIRNSAIFCGMISSFVDVRIGSGGPVRA